jgi:tetratricopeptide (TPR) repeat protein
VAAALLVAAAAGALTARQVLALWPGVRQFSKYPAAALRLLHGPAIGERLVDYSPLYLSVHTAAFGQLADPIAGVLLLQAACVGIAAGLLLLALRRHVGLPLALAGAAALALERSVTVHAYIFEPEALLLLLLAAWLFLAQREGLPSAAAAGAALGLALLTRPGLLPLAAVVPAAAALRGGSRRRTAACAVLALLPVAAALAALAVRDHRSTGSWAPVVMNPGTVFYDGNNPLGKGFTATYPLVVKDVAAAYPDESDYNHASYRRLARIDAGRELTVAEVNRFWAGKAWRFLADEPAEALRRLGRKAFLALHGYRWYDIRGALDADRDLGRRGVPATPLALVSALALVGAALGWRRRRELLPAYALLAAQLGVMLLTYASARQRIALLPALLVFAAVGASRLAEGGRRALPPAAVTLLLAGLLWRETDLMREQDRVTGLPPRATGADPGDDAPSRLDRAIFLLEDGSLDEAEPLFARLERERYPSLRGEPAYFLGRVAALRGRREDAAGFMRLALARAPGHPVVLAQLAALTGEEGYAERVFRYLDGSDARFELGKACLDNDRPEEAVRYLQRVAADLPEDRPAWELLERALTARAGAPAPPAPSPPPAP